MVSGCALCGVEITKKNDTEEHIIPNSIGGRKKVTGFICNTCNNKSGDTWEKALAKQLNPLSLFFRISRERGVAPPQNFKIASGNSLVLKHDGSMALPKPNYSEHVDNHKVNIQIQARDIREAKKMIKGVKRKYPEVDSDAFIEQAESKSSYCSEVMHFELSFCGNESGRSIIKSALAVIIDAGKSVSTCLAAIDYLKNKDAEACFGYYYEKDLVNNRPKGTPLHCVSVKADKDSGLILCYVEYFGIQRVVGCLSDSFCDESFIHTYAIDPVSGTELDLNIDLTLSLSDVRAAYNYQKAPAGAMEDAASSVVQAHLEKHNEKERERVINNALIQAFDEIGLKEGEQILPEHVPKMASIMSENLLPLLLHQIGMNKR